MRSQHQNKQNRPNLAEIQQAHCQVCFLAFDRAFPKRLQEGLQILFCSQCHIKVHKCCYDFQPSVTILSQEVSQFLCERCKNPAGKPATCLVCYGQEGAMKPIGEQQYVHVYCGLVHNDIDVVSYFPTISFRKSLQYQELSNICEICMKRNAHDQCAEESCRRKVHTYCAKTTYIKLAAEHDQPHSWNHHISAGNHGNFDLSEEIISYELYSDEVELILKDVTQAQIDLPNKQPLKRKIHKDYIEELRGKRKSTKKLRRGGFSYVLCSQHESTAYCVCLSKQQGEMVLCQCCFQWYHQKCINFKADEAEDRFVCQYCIVFYEFKKKAIQEVKGGRADADINKVELPLKFSVSDCMWLIKVIDNRIRGGQASKMLKQLSKYPLKSSCLDLLIRQQNRNKLNALAESFVHELLDSSQIVCNLRPRAVLSLGNDGEAVVVMESVEYNLRLRKVVQVLVGLGVPAESVVGLLAELNFKQKALSDQYETIIELSKSTEPYQEVPILKQKAQAFNFIEIVQKIQQKVSLPYQALLDAYQKTLNNSHVPSYMLTLISQKLATIQPLVKQITATISKDPQNLQKISLAVQQLQDEQIQPPPQYLQLKIQRKFIQDLYMYYNKYNPSQIEDQKTITQQIEILLAWNTLKPSQELVQIVNSYQPVATAPIWQRTNLLIKKCQSTVLEYEVKQILKRRTCKQERILQIMQNAASTDLQYHSQQVKAFIASWNSLKEKINATVTENLEPVQDYETISDLLKTTSEALTELDNLGIKLEDDGKTSLFYQLRLRKEELQQFQIILTQAQLQKNPLTISKILPSLPKSNPFIKQYYALKKQQSTLMNKYTTFLAKVSQRIQMFKSDSKKQRKDQIKENSQKPTLSQTRELIQSFKQSQIDFSRELKELTRILSNTLQIANKVSKYCDQKNDFSGVHSLDELTNRRKDIDELRRRVLAVAELSLKTELINLYHLEISLRMKNALLTPNIQQQKIGFLLKVAEEQSLTHDKLYIQLKDRYQMKNQKSKEVNQVKQLEGILNAEAARDSSPIYSSLANYRRGLPLLDPADIKIKNSYVEEVIEKNKTLRGKISSILSGKIKVDFQEVKPLLLQSLKNPFTIPDLNKLNQQINKVWDIIRRFKQNSHKWYSLSQSIFLDYQQSMFTVEQIQVVRRELKRNEDQLNHLKYMVQSGSTQSRDQIEEIVERIELNLVIKETPVCFAAQKQYLQYWMKLLTLLKASKSPVSYQKLRKLMLDAYNLLQRTLKRGQQYQDLAPIILQLQRYLTAVKVHLRQYPKYDAFYTLVDGFIDIEEFYLDNEEQPDLAELVPLYKPFDDMPKFRVKNLQRIQTKRDQISLKRSFSKFDQIKAPSDKNIQLSSQSVQEQARDVPLTVSDNQRRKIKEIFLRNIKKNPELRKFGQCENEVKMIQNQIFGEWHNDIVKYFEMSEQFQKLFIKLINCPNISNKIIKKKFQFKFINLLVGNIQKIDQLENMVINKMKQQEAVKTINETVSLPAPDLPSQPVLEPLSSAKFDEIAKEDLKKEMKIIKESRQAKQSKHKKKKHHKHKDRSHSPQAKFSSDSEKELPKYIENQYNKEEEKNASKIDPSTTRITESPLRYDPQEEEIQKKETIFPKGSAIKLKTCEAEIQTKKRGRVQFSIDLYTDEQHRKVMELVDPGCLKIPIRKQKNQSDILPYINKSRKKYRFVVGWFQATKSGQNQLLKEVAQEATQKKKVFGWQCDHIKLHMMSVKQLVTIPKMNIPSRVTTKQAADFLSEDRLIFVLQYPQRLYQLKDQYKNFQNLQCKIQLFNVNVPLPMIESKPINDYYHNYTVPTIEPLVKPVFKQPQVVYETWGSQPTVLPTPPPMPLQAQQQYGVHPRVNQARIQYGFGNYSPILTDSQDNDQDKNERQDLADNLLNSLDSAKIIPNPSISRQKATNQQYQPPYYGGYNQYQAPPQRQIPSDNRWMPYQHMNQPPQPQHVYNPLNPLNPLNPMVPKFNNPMNPMAQNPITPQQMGQNPMNQGQMGQGPINQGQMGQGPISQGQMMPGQMGQGGMMGMYKNPMMGQRGNQIGMGGHYYDPRYSGYQHQQ